MGFTAAVKNAMLDAILQTTPAPWVALHSGDPGANGANEITGNGCGREQVAFTAANAGASPNTAEETFGPASGSAWAAATHFGLWSAETEGTFLGGFALSTPRTVTVGASGVFAAGDLVATISDPA